MHIFCLQLTALPFSLICCNLPSIRKFFQRFEGISLDTCLQCLFSFVSSCICDNMFIQWGMHFTFLPKTRFRTWLNADDTFQHQNSPLSTRPEVPREAASHAQNRDSALCSKMLFGFGSIRKCRLACVKTLLMIWHDLGKGLASSLEIFCQTLRSEIRLKQFIWRLYVLRFVVDYPLQWWTNFATALNNRKQPSSHIGWLCLSKFCWHALRKHWSFLSL